MLEELASTFPILTCILFLPVIGAVVLWLFDDEDMVRISALAVALIELVLSVFVLIRFTPDSAAMDSHSRNQLPPRGRRDQCALRRAHRLPHGPDRDLFLGHRPPSSEALHDG